MAPLALPVIGSHARPVPRDRTVWAALRWSSIVGALVLTSLAFIEPLWALRLFWGALIPLAPIIFLAAPGLWRNICPLAAVGQLPRRWLPIRGRSLPVAVQRRAPWIAGGLFILIVPLRHVLLDHSGVAFGVFLLAVFCLSFLGGFLFKGKSGWCSQFCPMLHVERFYGQRPLLVLRDRHCLPCTGCTKGCFDLRHRTGALASVQPTDMQPARYTLVFASMMPWLILEFFTQPDLAHVTTYAVIAAYARALLFIGAGIGMSHLAVRLRALTPQQCVIVNMLAAFNMYYAFVTPTSLAQFDLPSNPIALIVQTGIYMLSVIWLARMQRAVVEVQPAIITGEPAFGERQTLAGQPRSVA
jgi:nitrite reductase (NADH) large subunit